MNRQIDPNIIFGILIFIIFIIWGGAQVFFVVLPVGLIAGIIYFITRSNHINPNFNFRNINQGTLYASRQTALSNVRLYLAPYKNVWRDLRVSNKFCTLRLGSDGRTITGTEKNGTSHYRKFKIVESKIHTMAELWDMFCLNYDHSTSYDGLIELCNLFRAVYIEDYVGIRPIGSKPVIAQKEEVNTNEKLDINNASEVEITALPGISIVLSKKLIKRREEIGGFKSVEDVFLFLKLKPHMEEQLRKLICVKKMKGSIQMQRTNERSVDI
ncbi:helix-hairpin-helix domain-containing protein [bacterium]|nr:helix-hairpin-helix domain-containing protein [bacterium]